MASNFGLLFFLLFICCAVCQSSVSQNLTAFNNNIPTKNLLATVLPGPVFMNNIPGTATLFVQAAYSLLVCVSPNTAINYNLQTACPKANLYNFTYDQTLSGPIALFLDDFSLNFRGISLLSQTDSVDAPPFTILSHDNIVLLQNVPYFVSVAIQPNQNSNTTETFATVYLQVANATCPGQTVPDIDGNCDKLNAELNVNLNISRVVSLIRSDKSSLISYFVPPLVPNMTLIFEAINSLRTQDFTIYLSFGIVPTEKSYEFKINSTGITNHHPGPLADQNSTVFSGNVTFPVTGNYYGLLTTNSTKDVSLSTEYIAESCNVSTAGSCGVLFNDVYDSTQVDSFSATFSSGFTYVSVTGTTLQLGVTAGSDDVLHIYVGINFIPSPSTVVDGTLHYSGNASLFVSLNTSAVIVNNTAESELPQSNSVNTYIVAISGPLGVSSTIWVGSICINNCNSHGSCDTTQTTPACNCDSDYSGDSCQNHHQKLKTLYIILIIIGAAILLAVIIGVPVALYLNNRKRARYERV